MQWHAHRFINKRCSSDPFVLSRLNRIRREIIPVFRVPITSQLIELPSWSARQDITTEFLSFGGKALKKNRSLRGKHQFSRQPICVLRMSRFDYGFWKKSRVQGCLSPLFIGCSLVWVSLDQITT